MDTDDDNELIDELVDEAFDCIDAADYAGAIKIARRLKRLNHSWAFEILALAYTGMDRRQDAIAVLEQGVAQAPEVWRLWQLLGNYYSDDGRFEDCHRAYRSALECQDCDESSVHLNFAIALTRQEGLRQALWHLNRVTDEQMKLQALELRLEVFNRLEWYVQAIELGKRVLGAYDPDDQDDEGRQALSKIHAEVGLGLWMSRKDREAALARAWEAVSIDKGQHTAMWLVREIDGEVSSSASYYRIVVKGTWLEPIERDGEWGLPEFLAEYEVVADGPEEALELVRPFEPAEIRDTLELAEHEAVEECPDQPKGVYAVPDAYEFLPADSGE